MAEFHKHIYRHDFSTMADGVIDFGKYSDFYVVTITFEANTLDNTDATVAFMQRADSTATWKNPTGLSSTLTGTPTSDELCNGDFGSQNVGVRIAKNSCTTGIIDFFITAKSDE